MPSPAYDAMSPNERRQLRLQNPWSFLNVTLSPEDVAEHEPVSDQQLLALARESLDRILTAGAFSQPNESALYMYRLRSDDHQQIALIADISVNDYVDGKVKIHEQVRDHRAELLGQHLHHIGVSSSPIALTYKNNASITELMSKAIAAQPDLIIPGDQGIEQAVWKINDAYSIKQLCDAFANQTLYIIDGHHRAAAALSVRENNNTPATQHMFGALFPDDSLQLLGFNRWIKPATEDPLARKLITHASAQHLDCYQPPQPGHVIVRVDNQWLRITLPDGDSYDAQKLLEHILQPVFSIEAADDQRIINVPGDQPPERLAQKIDQCGGAGFYLAPLSIEQFIDAADSGVPLPPKSTYFTPKVQSGVFLRPIR